MMRANVNAKAKKKKLENRDVKRTMKNCKSVKKLNHEYETSLK